jgi:hypothetical protein
VPLKYWEIIADNLSKAGWSWGCVSALDCEGRTIWIADAHRNNGKRFVVHADEKLTAFLETGSGDLDSLLGSDIRINTVGDLFLKNQGLSPIDSRVASNY